MPLSPPAPRTARHTRRVTYQGYEREDGLWDIEGELHDSKTFDMPCLLEPGFVRPAGQPVHHMWIRVTVDTQLVVQAIEGCLDAHPLRECPEASRALQGMVGSCMARGWRQAIQTHLGGVASCTHLRELLFNLATAGFQTVLAAFAPEGDAPPRHLGQCLGWDFEGPGVQLHFPKFYGHAGNVLPGSKPPTKRAVPTPAMDTPQD
jgi:hypothetical protein